MNKFIIKDIVRQALREDIGNRDITSACLISPDTSVKAKIVANESGVVAGIDVARLAFGLLNTRIKFVPLLSDGDRFKKDIVIARIYGPALNILAAERTALNFLSRLSGIATLTWRFVKEVRGTGAKIMDTRKTTPRLRYFEKYAVRIGGGCNHRMGLFDQVLIKDNHIAAYALQGKDTSTFDLIEKIISKAKKKAPVKSIEIEVKNLKDFKRALKTGADIIMLDNMPLAQIKKAVILRGKRRKPLLEASGGINLKNVRAIAKTGVDWISIGSLTHSATAIDFSLEICRNLN